MTSADLFTQFMDFQYKARAGKIGTNFSVLAKSMVSCNRNVYSSNKNTFDVTEHLYTGEGNPIEYWYYNGKAVHDEIINIIKEKYINDREYIAIEKAKEDYKRIHGKEPDYGNFNEILEYSLDVGAIARNSLAGSNNNTFCFNGERINSFGTRISNFDQIIREYKKVTNKDKLLKEKVEAETAVKNIKRYINEREGEIDRLKKEKKDRLVKLKDETARLKEEIKETEKEVARLEKEYQEKKEAYEKLK